MPQIEKPQNNTKKHEKQIPTDEENFPQPTTFPHLSSRGSYIPPRGDLAFESLANTKKRFR